MLLLFNYIFPSARHHVSIIVPKVILFTRLNMRQFTCARSARACHSVLPEQGQHAAAALITRVRLPGLITAQQVRRRLLREEGCWRGVGRGAGWVLEGMLDGFWKGC